MVNVAGNTTRVNLKNDQTYSITAAISINTGDVEAIWGYTSSYGDGGRAIIDGGTSGASYVLLTFGASAPPVIVHSIEFRNNGATGSANGVTVSSNGVMFYRCVFHDVRGNGVLDSLRASFIECEAYACNQSNSASLAGFNSSVSSITLIRCIAHDNSGSNTSGARFQTGGVAINCVFESNGAFGLNCTSSSAPALISGCDFYSNTDDGLFVTTNRLTYVENSNFFNNGGWGIGASAAGTNEGLIYNCMFGSGTMENTSGTIEGGDDHGSLTFTANETPWADPDNGDFRITSALVANAGRGTFLETASSYSGTEAFPCIGAAQPAAASSESGVIFQPQGSLGAGSNKTTQTTVTINSAITMTAGQLAVIIVGSDNEDTSDGETSLHASVTIDGNGCTKLAEFTNSQGSANAGATVSLWYLIAPSDIASGSAIVGTHNTGKDAKAICAYVFDFDATYTESEDGSATLANDGADPGSMSATGSLDVPHLWVRAMAGESPDATVGTLTPTAGWTSIPGSGTSGGGAETNISVRGEFKVLSGTASGTSDPTAVSADWASVLVGIAASLPGGESDTPVSKVIIVGSGIRNY